MPPYMDFGCGSGYYGAARIAAMAAAMRDFDDEAGAWSAVWKTDFTRKLIRIIFNRQLCGFSKEDFASPTYEELRFEAIAGLLEILAGCLKNVPNQGQSPRANPEFERVMDIFQDEFPRFCERIWEIREPFLYSKGHRFQSLYSEPAHPFSEHLASLSLFVCRELKYERVTVINRTNSCMPHIMLLIWSLAGSYPARRDALDALLETLGDKAGPQPELIQSFMNGHTAQTYIRLAADRDLKDSRFVDDSLERLVEGIIKIYSCLSRDESRLSLLLPGYLAAARRQLCLGKRLRRRDGTDDQGDGIVLFVFKVIANVFVPPAGYAVSTPSTAQAYCILALMARPLVSVVERNSSIAAYARAMQLVHCCITHLRTCNPASEDDKLAAMRRHTRALWGASCDDATRRQLSQRHPRWRPFLRTWRTMGDVLRLPPGDAPAESPWEVASRCGWRECLCSVYRPAHKLKKRQGCLGVYYCGTRCQQSDWDVGGHKEDCRSNTVSSA